MLGACALTACADPVPDQAGPATQAAAGTADPAAPGSERFLQAVASCMVSAGFDARVDAENGRVLYAVPTEQRSARDEAEQVCLDELSEAGAIEEVGGQGPEGDELSALYDQWQSATQCLREAGYEIESMPSMEVFADDPGAHNPLFDVVSLDEVAADPAGTRELVEQLQDECRL